MANQMCVVVPCSSCADDVWFQVDMGVVGGDPTFERRGCACRMSSTRLGTLAAEAVAYAAQFAVGEPVERPADAPEWLVVQVLGGYASVVWSVERDADAAVVGMYHRLDSDLAQEHAGRLNI